MRINYLALALFACCVLCGCANTGNPELHSTSAIYSTNFVEQLQAVLNRGLAEGDAALADSTALPGHKVLRAAAPAPPAGHPRHRRLVGCFVGLGQRSRS